MLRHGGSRFSDVVKPHMTGPGSLVETKTRVARTTRLVLISGMLECVHCACAWQGGEELGEAFSLEGETRRRPIKIFFSNLPCFPHNYDRPGSVICG